jgi:hypothetical protein
VLRRPVESALDARYLVAHALLAYDREHATGYFHGLRVEDVTVHETRIDQLLEDLALPAPVRADVLAWYAKHLLGPEAILTANQPYQGVLGVIRWFQLQPATCVAFNTGRPEEIRDLTLQALNALGKASRVSFPSDLLWMNPSGWGQQVAESKGGLHPAAPGAGAAGGGRRGQRAGHHPGHGRG